ncbi:Voltage-dependent anion channel [Trema orientale]|uniref:Voltage-dependent anion channel n=1 Tax=Trema orientale TaxID=63057 RepID=A0A2P5CME9_TREOI|nr:Voltage-dependent anion channel [Trema orientale]
MDQTHSLQTQIELVVESPQARVTADLEPNIKGPDNDQIIKHEMIKRPILSPILTKFHAGYFRISLSLCSQALLWKVLVEPNDDVHSLRQVFRLVPPTAFNFLWSLALFTLVSQSLLYVLRCLLHFEMVKAEFLHHVGVNYLFAPWISWLLLLQSSPFITPKTLYYHVFWWVFVVPIVVLDVKIYGQWFTKGKRFLSTVANPTSQLSVIGNLVAARAAAQMGSRESAVCMFSLGISHYLVLFVTLYQRLSGNDTLPAMLRPVFFLFIGAPSVASLAWGSISGKFDSASKMLFFLSLFLFMSLVSRPELFRKSMKKFHVAWWAYSFPLTVLALAAIEYAEEVKGGIAHALMIVLSALSVLVCAVLIVITAVHSHILLPDANSRPSSTSTTRSPRRCDST